MNIDLWSFIFGAWAGGMLAGFVAILFSLMPFDCDFSELNEESK